MTTDFAKMVAHVEKAKAELEEAIASFSLMERPTIASSYVMGHLRAGLAVCDSASRFILEVKAAEQKPKAPDPTGAMA
jgi:hypothetical protein